MRRVLPLLLVLLAFPATAAAVPGPALTVDAGADRHAISPGIYGMNGADPALAAELRLPVDRWGGNDRERYNWRLATKNTGADYFYENVADCFQAPTGCNPGDPAADGAYRRMIERDRAAGGTTVLQIPLIGWVAKDRPLDHPFSCGFPVDAYPLTPQSSWDTWDTNCGNGRAADEEHPGVPNDPNRGGDPIPVPPASATAVAQRTSIPFGPADAKAWVQDLVARYGDAAHGGVGYYELGNEPNLWNSSHRDVHPAPTTYDELRDKSVAMATAIKEADPTAKVIGFSEWGWTNYFCSALDVAPLGYGCGPGHDNPDRAAHQGKELSAWYLEQMKGESATAGRRLLDDFDLHYYAQAGGYGLDASRALWDPTYVDGSWIGTAGENAAVRLLPRMRAWVDENYPGTGISLSEYNLTDLSDGEKDSIVGTLSEADALGIFAREGVDMAAMWAPPSAGQRVADAFRLYRDYDRQGSRFGDTWVRSTSTDQGRLAVYGAERASDGALTVAVLNKSPDTLDAPFQVGGFAAGGPTQVWRWTGRGIAHEANLSAGTTTASFPPRSMTLLVLPRDAGTTDPPGGGGDPPAGTTPTTPIPPPPPPTTPTTPQTITHVTPPPPPVAPLARVTTKRVTLRGRTIALRVACPASKTGCGGTLALRSGRTTLVSKRLSLRGGVTSTVRVVLSRSRARSVARYGRKGRAVKATVTVGRRTATTALRLRGR